MSEKIRNFLQGMGSVMNIAPNSDYYEEFVLNESLEDTMRGPWEVAGISIGHAMEQFANETEFVDEQERQTSPIKAAESA